MQGRGVGLPLGGALDLEILARFDAAWSSGRDPEDVRDEYEATLEKLGI